MVMEKGGNGNSGSEIAYKDLSARYESLLREDMKMWGTKEEKNIWKKNRRNQKRSFGKISLFQK